MLLRDELLPDWFTYTEELIVLLDQNLLDFDPWIILTEERLATRFERDIPSET